MTDKEYLQAIVREAVEDTLYEFKSDLERDVSARNQYDKIRSHLGHSAMAKAGAKFPSYGDTQRFVDGIGSNNGNGRVSTKMGYHALNVANKAGTAVNNNDRLSRRKIDKVDKAFKNAVGESFYAGDLNDREIIDAYCEGYLSDADIAEGFRYDIVSEAVLSYLSEID